MVLRGQVAHVFGASRGVGRAIAEALAREGADLAISGRSPERLEATAAAVRAHGRRCLALGCDVANERAVIDAVARTGQELGAIDIAVNSTVYMDPPGPLLEMPSEVWERTMAVDVNGAFYISKHVLGAMLPRGTGRLIHISSALAGHGSVMRSAYAAAKSAMSSLVQSCALAVAKTSIKVNAISPMGIAGEHNKEMRAMFRSLKGEAPESDAEYERVRATMMQPADVAELAVFLASPAGIRFNGQSIVIGEPSTSGI